MKNQYEIDYQQGYDSANDEWLDRMDKIKAEIEQLPTNYMEIQRPHSVVERDVVELGAVMRIIDKYKAESEVNNGSNNS